MIFSRQTGILSAIILTGAVILHFSCNGYNKNESHRDIPDSNIAKGKKLAAAYCQSCHLLPDPSLLDARNWENGVLPAMGPRFGIFSHNGKPYPSSRNDMELPRDFYPPSPILKPEDWQNIIDYYSALSPDSLAAPERKRSVAPNNQLFRVEEIIFKNKVPTTCLVKIDTTVLPRQILSADMLDEHIYRFNNQYALLDTFKSVSPVVDIELHQHYFMSCNIGIMNPNNGKYGTGRRINVDDHGKMKEDTILRFEGLSRPVQLTSADFNNDGKMDYLVCEFGHMVGDLSWMENKGDNKFVRHVLRAYPGAIKAYIRDVNNDGLPDIWVLFSQGEEGVFLFTNKGNGEFDQKQVLRFPPIYGSSYFELDDFNNDGFPDILYTCGDNADYSPALKPYHGAYIFMNDGKNNFKQEYFFPMYGCFKAIARDYDGDGDLDIAAISFFADYTNHPEESVIYLENIGGLDFQPYNIPNTNSGRWLTMDAGDIDGDGKIDLVIGNFSVAPATLKSATDWKSGPALVVLKNIMKSKK